MIDYGTALEQILAQVRACPAEPCASLEADGRILAEAVCSGENLPPFDNSAMDGFALRSEGRELACGREFRIHGVLMAGDEAATRIETRDCAWEIMTGARLPADADSVVPVEQVSILERDAKGLARRIRLETDVEVGRHVRRAGEDVAAGEVVMPQGMQLAAPQLAMLSALGIGTVSVRRRPRVALICTGKELLDDPAEPLREGQIRNSNAPLLAGRIRAAGADLVMQRTVTDEPVRFLAMLEEARTAGVDVFISTGAVSMGQKDFVPEALQQAGARLHFHKVRIRPGKPLLFADFPEGMLCFGLPGNPASSAVGMRFFIEPALRVMLGLEPERPLRVPLEARQKQLPGWRYFLKARLLLNADGQVQARILPGQESFRIRPLLEANAWVVMPGDAEARAAGAMVEAWPPGHLEGLHLER